LTKLVETSPCTQHPSAAALPTPIDYRISDQFWQPNRWATEYGGFCRSVIDASKIRSRGTIPATEPVHRGARRGTGVGVRRAGFCRSITEAYRIRSWRAIPAAKPVSLRTRRGTGGGVRRIGRSVRGAGRRRRRRRGYV